jgi:hypothetical protein
MSYFELNLEILELKLTFMSGFVNISTGGIPLSRHKSMIAEKKGQHITTAPVPDSVLIFT